VGSRFQLRAATDGALLDRIAPLGRILEPGEDLARIGDPGALWIEGQVRERDATRLHKGQQVEFTADGGALARTAGTVIWVASFLDPQSRTATVRVQPDQRDGRLRAHEFGRLQLARGPAEPAILVPEDAVQWEGCCNVVFVQESATRYRPRKVEVAAGDAGHYRVTRGLSAEDRIVVDGSFLLKTELKKGAIGAGCCGLEAS
jgi:cobalt-zinc-cadmium efflux system membrane fusion protein